MFDSAKSILLDMPMSKEELITKTQEAIEINNIKDGYIRVVVTRGVGDLGLDPKTLRSPSSLE